MPDAFDFLVPFGLIVAAMILAPFEARRLQRQRRIRLGLDPDASWSIFLARARARRSRAERRAGIAAEPALLRSAENGRGVSRSRGRPPVDTWGWDE